MSNTVIKVENLSKQYRLGQIGTGTLSHDINRLWYRMRGKEDPYLKIGEANDRTVKGNSEYVWALRDINFDVKQGEILGIIGRNGAGKSTLLKILSKVTKPTKGNINIRGRIASLLEVGTGFHPELTGRDNIFLNGAILGMTKAEIRSKFDEIVEFSGVERYIDTPVKRYSSGMYVRLAFAVAAHLEPEILIVDEVLAVGDAEFQKKCLGKMKDVGSKEGRTVLFVSHNMHAISNICHSALYLTNGLVNQRGNTKEILDKYALDGARDNDSLLFNINDYKHRRGNGAVRFLKIHVTDSNGKETTEFKFGEVIYFNFCCVIHQKVDELLFSIYFKAPYTAEVITNTVVYDLAKDCVIEPGKEIHFKVEVDSSQFKCGFFDLYFWLGNRYEGGAYDIVDSLLPSIVINSDDQTIVDGIGFFHLKSYLKLLQ